MEFDITFWGSLLEIFAINLILSGDNAVVIALATLHLEEKDRKKGIFWGTFGAVALLIILTAGAVLLLTLPYIQAIGALFLFWIALKLLWNEEKGIGKEIAQKEENPSQVSHSLRQAIKTIIIADLVMSLDNVLAVAGASDGNFLIIGIGLSISIPIVIFGSTFLSTLMKKWPWLVFAGSAFLGYTAGEMILKDSSCAFLTEIQFLEQGLPWLLAGGMIVAGNIFKSKMFKRRAEENLEKNLVIQENSISKKPLQRKSEELLQESFVQVFAGKKERV